MFRRMSDGSTELIIAIYFSTNLTRGQNGSGVSKVMSLAEVAHVQVKNGHSAAFLYYISYLIPLILYSCRPPRCGAMWWSKAEKRIGSCLPKLNFHRWGSREHWQGQLCVPWNIENTSLLRKLTCEKWNQHLNISADKWAVSKASHNITWLPIMLN